MREVLSRIEEWRREGRRVALATVVKTWGSSPRPVGSKLAIADNGDMVGSVSGGCVEGAVIEQAVAAFESGNPALLHFGVSDEAAWSVGLSCGGEIDVFLEVLESSPERGDAAR